MLTIKDIARESGYAVSTVSRALNDRPDVSEKAKAHILAVAKARGFVPNVNAQQLKQQTSNAICVVVKGKANQLFSVIVEQMQNHIEQMGHVVALHYIDEDDNEVAVARRLSVERKPLGFIFLGGNGDNFRGQMEGIRRPAVLVTGPANQLGCDNLSSVTVDDQAAASMMIHHLLDCGHKNIAVLGGNIDTSYTSKSRYEGCLQAFEEAGIEFDEEKQFQRARFSFESAYMNMHSLWQKYPQMTALFAMSDVMAIGAVRALLDEGVQVPLDVSVAGFDGTELAKYYNPKITTVQQPLHMLAERGVEILLDHISRGGAASHEIVPCTLVMGESVQTI